MQAGRKHSFQPVIECLEERDLLASHLTATLSGGLLRINGTNQADAIVVRQTNNRISVAQAEIRVGNSRVASVSASSVRKIEVRSGNGNDRVSLDSETRRGQQALRMPVTVWAGAGNDTVRGGQGEDRIYGGSGDDLIYGRGGKDLLDGGAGNDRLYGGLGDDRLYGGDGRDQLHGEAGRDSLFGGAGDDQLLGGTSNDYLDGGTGSNRLSGQSGNDLLLSRSGRDVLDGGSGVDSARFFHASAPRSTAEITGNIRSIERFTSSRGTTTAPPGAVNPAPPGPFQAEVNRILQLTNAYRASRGLSRLTVDPRLTAAARVQATYMARTGDYSHVARDGTTLVDRVRAAKYPFSFVAENIHLYDPDIARTYGIDRPYQLSELADYFFDGWKVSPAHNHNLLASQAIHVGIALARASSGDVYAVQVLGRT